MSETAAPTTNEVIEKVNRNYFYSFGPHNWTENRNDDGLVISLDIIVHGWRETHLPGTITFNSGEEFTNYAEEGEAKSESFNWPIPSELQTTCTWHNHEHPHNEENDDEYGEKSLQWIKQIMLTQDYIDAIESVKTQLEAL